MTQRHKLSYKELFWQHLDEVASLDRWMRIQCRDPRLWRQPGLGSLPGFATVVGLGQFLSFPNRFPHWQKGVSERHLAGCTGGINILASVKHFAHYLICSMCSGSSGWRKLSRPRSCARQMASCSSDFLSLPSAEDFITRCSFVFHLFLGLQMSVFHLGLAIMLPCFSLQIST